MGRGEVVWKKGGGWGTAPYCAWLGPEYGPEPSDRAEEATHQCTVESLHTWSTQSRLGYQKLPSSPQTQLGENLWFQTEHRSKSCHYNVHASVATCTIFR